MALTEGETAIVVELVQIKRLLLRMQGETDEARDKIADDIKKTDAFRKW